MKKIKTQRIFLSERYLLDIELVEYVFAAGETPDNDVSNELHGKIVFLDDNGNKVILKTVKLFEKPIHGFDYEEILKGFLVSKANNSLNNDKFTVNESERIKRDNCYKFFDNSLFKEYREYLHKDLRDVCDDLAGIYIELDKGCEETYS